jgi:hydrogenase maturation protease
MPTSTPQLTPTPPPAPAAAAPVLVLGLGNDILCDDAIGLRVVRRVAEQLAASPDPDIAVAETQEMGLCLLDHIADRRDLVLVDSIQTGTAPPGHLHEMGADDLRRLAGPSPHFLGVGETLALGRQLGLAMPQRVRILAIEVAEPRVLSAAMTPALEAALPALADRTLAAARELVAKVENELQPF